MLFVMTFCALVLLYIIVYYRIHLSCTYLNKFDYVIVVCATKRLETF